MKQDKEVKSGLGEAADNGGKHTGTQTIRTGNTKNTEYWFGEVNFY